MTDEDRAAMWRDRLAYMEAKVSALPCDTDIGRARRRISDACRDAAALPPGAFRLHVPTGGGKTLAGLRFALRHAAIHGMRRIVSVAPRLSIIDWNAAVWRDYIGDDAMVLEQHSNVVDMHGRSYAEQAILSEGWDAPVVVTTTVQFLDALFSGDMQALRRMHALCGSVVLLDEVQAMPDNQLGLFCLAVNFLVRVCGATVVLCSATQPAFDALRHSTCVPVRNIEVPETAPVFRRADIVPVNRQMDACDVGDDALGLLDRHGSVLVVCNKKAEAIEVYRHLSDAAGSVYHLSASMCQRHRMDVMKELVASLEAGRRTACVSTQVIEAGVDISFGSAIRVLAGWDSVMQTLGRVNRHGELGPDAAVPLHVVQWKGEELKGLPEIELGQAASLALLAEYAVRPDAFGKSLSSDEAVSYYYRVLYGRGDPDRYDYPLGRDRGSIFELLSLNRTYCRRREYAHCMRQAFRAAGDSYTVFGSGTRDVVVPYGAGKGLIDDLNSDLALRDLGYAKRLLRQAKPYTVSVFRWQFDQLERCGALVELAGGAFGVHGCYDAELGLIVPCSGGRGIFV